jgi:hypothetical protein
MHQLTLPIDEASIKQFHLFLTCFTKLSDLLLISFFGAKPVAGARYLRNVPFYKVNNKSHSIIHQGLSIAKASYSPVPSKLATLS